MKYFIIINLLCFSFLQQLSSQDFEFTQFGLVPLHLNPANAGNFDGKFRLSSIYRDQWGNILQDEVYKSGAFSIDAKIPFGEFSEFGIGFQLGVLKTNMRVIGKNSNAGFSGSFTHYIIKENDSYHALSFGANLSYSSLKMDYTTIGSDEIISSTYTDLGAGVLWKSNFNSGFKANIGYSIYHLNEPDISVGGYVKSRSLLYGDFEFPSDLFSIVPSFIFYSHEEIYSFQIQLATRLYFDNKQELKNWVQFGFIGRSNTYPIQENPFSTFGFTGQLNIKNFNLGMSYDLSGFFHKRSFEFSLGYIIGSEKVR